MITSDPATTWINPSEMQQTRPLVPALVRGLLCRCPNCGEGKMFRAYLKVADHCTACGEELRHHRADDAPAYVVIVLLGHILVSLVVAVETHFEWSYLMHAIVWPPLTLALTLALLPPVKGAIVAMQWALRMHGFGNPHAPDIAH
jgi:uncharacterized protein (DUF983 family)